MSAWNFDSGIRLKWMLILAASFVICGLSSIYGDEEAKPELEIKRISSRGIGVKKIEIPGADRVVYVIGSSKERVFAIKIKNNAKEEKRDVWVKLSAYDKDSKLIGEKAAEGLGSLYADKGYLIEEGILYARKTVELYFVVRKKTKYVKAELFYQDELIDTEVYPSSFKPPEKPPEKQ